ncbi:gliding motility-associated C-terminal domain-containing protein [Pontibacter ruber]|uniref:Gliding motility-associated C-terminal domain-containing protein n=1 Tax=Pontibacter ruber TaxID=1343895 RepID=A0ABW5CZ68_9BACT|nr:gliding motility-associated C-terminal domain-containing protein [Pontibacter ruber]
MSGKEIQAICKGQRVRFKDCTGKVDPRNEYYVFEYSKSQGIPIVTDTVKFHTYTTPGTYRVLQIANQGGNTQTDTLSKVFVVKDTPLPTFTAAGCGNRQVRITITDKTYDTYTLDLGNGTTETVQSGQTKVYTYTTDGSYNLTLNGSYTGATCRISNSVTVQQLPPATMPRLTQLQVLKEGTQDGSLRLNIEQLPPSYLYIVERAQGSSYTSIDTIKTAPQGGTITYDLNNLNTTDAACYRIRVTDVCGTSVASSPVCLVKLQATAGNERADLSWQHTATNTGRYEVYRGNTLIQTLPATARTYTDTGIKCGENICYTIKAVSADGAITSVSAEKCVSITSTTVPVAGTLFSTFNLNNQVELTFQVPQEQEARQIVYQRSIEGAPYQQVAGVQQTTFTDQSISPAPVCYRASYTNACGTSSALSGSTCPVFLLATAQEGGPVLLAWTGFVGFTNGVGQYTLELLDETGNVIFSTPVSGNAYNDRSPSEDVQVLRYRIKATSRSGNATTYSNIAVIEQPLRLLVPSAFTPNGDGLNDVLVVKGKFFENFRITIYNRTGNVVYQGNDRNNGWDGTFEGREMPADAYAYEITYTTQDGTPKRRTGTVTLLR